MCGDPFLGPAVLILVILFQNDIRRALARVGRGFSPRLTERQESRVVEEVVRTAQELVRRRLGGLVVFERETRLDDLIEAATPLDAAVSKELLTSLFLPASPLHDGAVVLRGERVAAAGVILPIPGETPATRSMGTRHRAAWGIAAETDTVAVVVSEETGKVTVFHGREARVAPDAETLREILGQLLGEGRERVGAAA